MMSIGSILLPITAPMIVTTHGWRSFTSILISLTNSRCAKTRLVTAVDALKVLIILAAVPDRAVPVHAVVLVWNLLCSLRMLRGLDALDRPRGLPWPLRGDLAASWSLSRCASRSSQHAQRA